MSARSPQVDVYGLGTCTTCQKALAALEKEGATVRSFRDLKQDPLSREELTQLIARVGGPERLFSKRARKYRSLGLQDRELSPREMERLMLEEYTFITRPVVVGVAGKGAYCGPSAKARAALLASLREE